VTAVLDEIKKQIEGFQKSFEDFKKLNDQEIAQIKSAGSADPLLKEQVTKANTDVGELKKELEALQKSLKRKGSATAGGGEDGGDDPKAEAKAKHRKTYDRHLRKGGFESDLEELETELGLKGVSVGSNADGGYAVPDELDRNIVRVEADNTPMRDLATVMQVSNETYEKLVSLGGAASGWVDETDVGTVGRPETGTPQLASVKPFFGEVYAFPFSTQKALDDVMFDVEAWLASEVGIKLGEDENDAFTKGNGVKKPKGVLGYTLALTADGVRPFGQIQKIHSGTAGTFDGDDLLNVIYALKRGYRKNARWMMSSLGVAAVRKLKDLEGNYLWRPGLVDGQPDKLLNYAVEENDDWPDPAADANAIGFGDWKRLYLIADVRGVRVLRDPFEVKGKVGFYTTKRLGGGVVDDRAAKILTLSV
jgi:HK97 family phage major capsid protein